MDINESRVFHQIGINDVNRAAQIQSQYEIQVVLTDEAARQYQNQVTAEVAVNLLSRIFPHVTLKVRNEPCLLPHPYSTKLFEHLQSVKRTARKWEIAPSPQYTVRLVVGGGEPGEIHISGSGWLTSVGSRPVLLNGLPGDQNPLGAVMAGILGTAEVFKRTLGSLMPGTSCVLPEDVYIFSLLDYQCYNTEQIPENSPLIALNLCDPVLFGVGSVGSGCLHSLSYWPGLTGSIALVDNDAKIERRNLLRYSFMTEEDVHANQGISKVRWAANKLRQRCPALRVWPFNKTINQWHAEQPEDYNVLIAISAVDNPLARVEIAEVLAKRTLNAATDATRAEMTRHSFGQDGLACLACLYEYQHVRSRSLKYYMEQTGLSQVRINQLVNQNDSLTEDDLNILLTRGVLSEQDRNIWLGGALKSLLRERTYSAATINVPGGSNQVVTLAFVSQMAGTLIAAEIVKETVGLQGAWKGNRYYIDARFLPDSTPPLTEKHGARNKNNGIILGPGKCLCEHGFRQEAYRRKYYNEFTNNQPFPARG